MRFKEINLHVQTLLTITYSTINTKEKIKPVFRYRHEYKPVDRALITVFRDAMYGVMPPLGGGLWWETSNHNLLGWGDGCLFVV
jgi:hypothetical protein